MELSHQHLLAVLLWILWCSLHSALIAASVTGYMKKKLGDAYRFYRLLYNIVALITFIPLVLYSISLEKAPIFRWEGPLVIIRYMLSAASICLFVAGGRHYSLSKLLGIDQIRTRTAKHVLSEHDVFAASGILSAIRHPWYAGGILIIWARDISLFAFLNNIVISAYFVIGAYLEERKLVREFGEVYREYQKNVSMLFPYKWLKAKIAEPT